MTENWIAGVSRPTAEFPYAIECAEHALSGFPFRLDVQCSRLRATEIASGASSDLQFLQVTAPALPPGQFRAILKSPLILTSPAFSDPSTANWMSGSVMLALGFSGLREADIRFGGFLARHPLGAVASQSWSASLTETGSSASSALNTAARNLEITWQRGSLKIAELRGSALIDLPPAVLAELTSSQDWQKFREPIAIPNIATAIDFGGPAVSMVGDLQIAANGVVSGNLAVKIRNLTEFQSILAQWPDQISGLAGPIIGAIVSFGSQVGEENNLQISIQNGRVTAGPFPIGRIPPLRKG